MNSKKSLSIAAFFFFLCLQAGQAAAQIELKDADVSFIGENALGAFGYRQFSIIGDIDGDGSDDIAIGAPGEHYGKSVTPDEPCDYIDPGFCGCGGPDPGIVYVMFGRKEGWVSNLPIRQAADLIFVSPAPGARLGSSVVGGDLDGDGSDYLIIGAEGYGDSPVSERGKTYVLFGRDRAGWLNLPGYRDPDCANKDNDPRVKNIEEISDASFVGQYAGDGLGASISTVDLNNDGREDMILGAPGFDSRNYQTGDDETVQVGKGKAYIVFGAEKDDPRWMKGVDIVDVAEASLAGGHMNGERISGGLHHVDLINERLGFSISGLGDIDGDGSNDLIVGQGENDPNLLFRRQTYLVSGKDIVPGLQAAIETVAKTVFVAPDYREAKGLANLDPLWHTDFFGCDVSDAGDLNGDGSVDFIVGSEGYSRQTPEVMLARCGAAYIFFGRTADDPWDEVIEIGVDGQGADHVFYGALGYAKMGLSVEGLGDVDGDGIDDVLIGGATDKQGGAEDSGELFEHGPFSYSRADSFLVFGAASSSWSGYDYLYRNEAELYENHYAPDFQGFKTDVIDYARRSYRCFLGEESAKVGDLYPVADKTSSAGMVAGRGDVNGDGKNDFLVGDCLYSTIPDGEGVGLDDERIHQVNVGKVYLQFGNENLSERCEPDLWMRDSAEDQGNEPNIQSASVENSEDIWIRLEDDGGTSHQAPLYRPTPEGELPVYIHVTVRNTGSEWSDLEGENSDKLRVYWADRDDVLNWAGSFAEITDSPKAIGRLAPGESKVVKFEWRPPDPARIGEWPVSAGVCLVARIETGDSAPFGMTFPEGGDLWRNVRNNNNIVAKMDVPLGFVPTVSFTAASQTLFEGDGVATVTATLDQVTNKDVTVSYSLGGTASPGDDHDLGEGVLVFAAGQKTADIVFNIVDDSFRDPRTAFGFNCENDETVVITIGSVDGGFRGEPYQHVVTIKDNDMCPVLNVNAKLRFPTIQAAVDSEHTLEGHTLEVGDGQYSEQIVIDKQLDIMSVSVEKSPLILAQNSDAIVSSGKNVGVRGFSIANVIGKAGFKLTGGTASVSDVAVECADQSAGVAIMDGTADLRNIFVACSSGSTGVLAEGGSLSITDLSVECAGQSRAISIENGTVDLNAVSISCSDGSDGVTVENGEVNVEDLSVTCLNGGLGIEITGGTMNLKNSVIESAPGQPAIVMAGGIAAVDNVVLK